jgi:hypothetical protein
MAIDYASKIPNNVGLDGNKQLQRALEHWQPRTSTGGARWAPRAASRTTCTCARP